jgi:Pregnancy-associated plasma protein-A
MLLFKLVVLVPFFGACSARLRSQGKDNAEPKVEEFPTIDWSKDDSPVRIGSVQWNTIREFKQFGRSATKPASEEEWALSTSILRKWKDKNQGRRRLQAPIDVPLYIHCISSGPNGGCPNAAINQQVDVLNAAFSPHFIFTLISAQSVDRPGYYNCGFQSTVEEQLKNEFRQGGPEALNIYFCNTTMAGQGAPWSLGWATAPLSRASASLKKDGVVLSTETLPGGAAAPYNLGIMAVQQVGHWLGLLNTWQGGCEVGYTDWFWTSEGDHVYDTEPEASPAFGCPVGRSTCLPEGVDGLDPYGNPVGLDPIHNYMDATDDSCKEEFTPGQFDRMRAIWGEVRSPTRPTRSPTRSPTRLPTRRPSRRPTSSPVAAIPTVVTNSTKLTILVRHDNYPRETSWRFSLGNTLMFAQAANAQTVAGKVTNRTMTNLAKGLYTFVIEDTAGNGICCSRGNGGFSLQVEKQPLFAGGTFNQSVTVQVSII